jgi:hypothetical protein
MKNEIPSLGCHDEKKFAAAERHGRAIMAAEPPEIITTPSHSLPNVGFAREFQAATECGRAALAQQAEQRGLDSFQPARELNGNK